MSKNVVDPERLHSIWRMRVVCWIIKAKRANADASAHETTPAHT